MNAAIEPTESPGSNAGNGTPSTDSAPSLISAGKEAEGMNRTYCHPRASTVKSLTKALGGAGGKTVRSFDTDQRVACAKSSDANWVDVPASDNLWATERDGDVVLTTTGDGTFVREN